MRSSWMRMTVVAASALAMGTLMAEGQRAGERLLAMVPADAQIVTALRSGEGAVDKAQLSLVTRYNNQDFADWRALVSVDANMSGHDVVEVAGSSPRGDLEERLLLVDGRFDTERIDRALSANGAGTAEFGGVRVRVVLPFTRESALDPGVRWLAFPNERTCLFGTPLLVQRALTRRQAHAGVDEALAARVGRLRPDVQAWSVVRLPGALFRRKLGDATGLTAQVVAATGSEDLAIGARSGSGARVDFVAATEPGEDAVARVRAAGLQSAVLAPQQARFRVERVAVEDGRVAGTLSVRTGDRVAARPGSELAAR